MSVNKHKVLREYVEQFLEDNYLYFESTEAYPQVRAIIPNYGDFINKTDVLGCKYKSYTFAFIGYDMLDTGTSDNNADNMEVYDMFSDWIVEQNELQNFPNFGENCSEYSMEPLQNMAQVTIMNTDGLARYMLAVRIDYKEE